jgi:hypothetical protein
MDLTSLAKKEWVWLIVLAILFLGLRLPAIHSPYHQDEYKLPMYADPQFFQPAQ